MYEQTAFESQNIIITTFSISILQLLFMRKDVKTGAPLDALQTPCFF